jgi:hypothetical protein
MQHANANADMSGTTGLAWCDDLHMSLSCVATSYWPSMASTDKRWNRTCEALGAGA